MKALTTAVLSVATALCFGAMVTLGVGFVGFASEAAEPEPEPRSLRADAIVALTGGSQRVADATRLLAAGHARRMLITGVHPGTSRDELARTVGHGGRVFHCCIDLDYDALNTVGNAVETRRWVREHGFRSLIVVTSNYHMPRTLLELGNRLPDVQLKPYPVSSARLRMDRWWEHPATARVLVGEYLKYLYARARLAVMSDEPEEERPEGRTANLGLPGTTR